MDNFTYFTKEIPNLYHNEYDAGQQEENEGSSRNGFFKISQFVGKGDTKKTEFQGMVHILKLVHLNDFSWIKKRKSL